MKVGLEITHLLQLLCNTHDPMLHAHTNELDIDQTFLFNWVVWQVMFQCCGLWNNLNIQCILSKYIILGVDILGIDILWVYILGVDILGRTQHHTIGAINICTYVAQDN